MRFIHIVRWPVEQIKIGDRPSQSCEGTCRCGGRRAACEMKELQPTRLPLQVYFGAGDAASFWKRWSLRIWSHTGSSRNSAGVSGKAYGICSNRLRMGMAWSASPSRGAQCMSIANECYRFFKLGSSRLSFRTKSRNPSWWSVTIERNVRIGVETNWLRSVQPGEPIVRLDSHSAATTVAGESSLTCNGRSRHQVQS